jgi:hypothetical protein
MKVFFTFYIFVVSSIELNSQTLNVVPDTMNRGKLNTIIFSGSAINFSTNPCIKVILTQGSNVIYQASSNLYYSASNVLVTSFYIASNAFVGNYTIQFIDTCIGMTVSSFPGKMRVKFASYIREISDLIEFYIFPNPVVKGEDFEILSESNIISKNTLNIYSMDGRLIFNEKNVKNATKINTEFLNSGIYFVEFSNEKGVKSTKRIEVK